MGLFSRVRKKLKARKGIAPRMPRGGFARGLFRRKPLGIEKLITEKRPLFINRLRDSNIDFGIDFSRRSGSGGFRPIGDGRLAPISGSVNPGFNMEPKDPQKRLALQDAFARFREQLRNQQQPQPLQEVEMSGVGTLPLKNLGLPDFLQRVPNPMENLPNLNIPTGMQNFKFSPDFGNYVPMFNKGTDVSKFEMVPPQSALAPLSELRASQLIFSLNSQAENLMNQMLMEERNGEIERAMETGRQIQNINDEIAEIKGKVGESKYMMDQIRSPIPEFSGGGIATLLSKIPFLKRFFSPKPTVLDDIPYQGMIGTKAGLGSGKFRIPNPGRYAVPVPGAMSSMARNKMIDDVTRKALGLGAIGAGGYGVVTYPEELGALVAKGQLSFEEAFEQAKQAIQPSLLETKDAITDIGEDASTEIGIIRSRLQQGYQDEMNRQKAEEIQQLIEEDKPLVPVFKDGGETVATAPRIKKPTTVLTDFSDPLVDVEQEELLADLVKKAELQSLIEELLEDRGRTVSDLDMMTILQQSSSGQPSMV